MRRLLKVILVWVSFQVLEGAKLHELSFSVYLEINGELIYPYTPDKMPPARPFVMDILIKGAGLRSFEQIVLDFLRTQLSVQSIERIWIVPYIFSEVVDAMIVPVVSPVCSEASSDGFESFESLLLLSGDKLDQLNGKSFKVHIQSNSDSIFTVGKRLRERECRENPSDSKL